MSDESGDAHTITEVLVGGEEYQAPPREESKSQTEANDNALEELKDQAAEEPVNNDLVEEEQEQPGNSAPIPVAPRDRKNFVVSGPDEMTQPGKPHVPPPGESM